MCQHGRHTIIGHVALIIITPGERGYVPSHLNQQWELNHCLACVAAGLPSENDRTFCTSNVSAACYFYQSTAATYPIAKTRCESMGGFLASWNSAAEQVRDGVVS
jgi:hypothetical protein